MAQEKKEVETVEEQVVDLSSGALTFAEQMKKWQTNSVELCAEVVKATLSTPKPKMVEVDGKKVHQVLDGILQYWDAKLYVDIAFNGGSMSLSFPEKDIENLHIGERYMFSGRMALDYGKIQAVFDTYTKVI